MKKSKILQIAIDKHLCKYGEETEEKSRYLCISLCYVDAKEVDKEDIRADILKDIGYYMTVESYMRSVNPTPQRTYDFRIGLANKLITKYKEQEKCNKPSTKLSNLFSKLKVALKNKLS